jgi:hypothetical protein
VLKSFVEKEVIPTTHVFEDSGEISLWFSSSKPRGAGKAATNRTIDFQVSNPKAGVDEPTRILRMGTRVILCYKTVEEAERAIDAGLETFGIQVDPELLELDKELAKLLKKKKELVAKKTTSTAASSSLRRLPPQQRQRRTTSPTCWRRRMTRRMTRRSSTSPMSCPPRTRASDEPVRV